MDISLFQPKYRPIQNPVDLNILANTYNTLEKGHQAAVAQTAAYKQALNELDLNEAEDAWVVQRQQQIQDAFNNNLVYGNAAAAVDDIVKTFGDISADPAMKGRLRAQQDYKTYIANLDANKTLDEDTKEYYRQKNKYYYQDNYDNEGNIIGGTKWSPIEREVNHIPLNLVFEQALKWAAKEEGMGNTVKFLDANGNPTNDYSKSVTGEIFTNISGKWEKLGEDKVRAAINAAFESIPGAKESFEQQYKIANWKYDNGKVSDITDRNGVKMTKEQYLNSKINPFVNAVTYHNSYNTITYGDAWKSQLAARGQVGKSVTTEISPEKLRGLASVQGDLIQVKNNAPIEAQASITANRQELSNILNNTLSNKIDLHTANSEDIINAISTIQDPQLRAQAASYHWKIQNDLEYINSISEGHPDKDAFDAYNSIMSMSDLPDNSYGKTWANMLNNLFDGAESVRQYFDEDEFNAFKNNVGLDNIRKSGIVLGTDKNGYKYVQLNADNYAAAYTYANGIKQSEDGFWGKLFSLDRTNKLVRVRNGEEESIDKMVQVPGTQTTGSISSKIYIDGIVSFVDSLSRASDRVLDGGTIIKSNIGLGAPTPEIANLDILIKNGIDITENKAKRDNAYNQFVSNITGISLTQSNGYILDPETNAYRQMTSEEALENTKILRSDVAKDLKYMIVPDPVNGDASVQVIVPGQLDDAYDSYKREPRSFIIGSTAITDESIKSWNNNTSWLAMNKINKYADSNRPLGITNDVVFDGVPLIKFKPNGINNIIIDVNGVDVGMIDRGTASTYLDPIIQVQQVAEYSKYNDYPTELIRPLVQKAAASIAGMTTNDATDAAYFESIIMQNLGY